MAGRLAEYKLCFAKIRKQLEEEKAWTSTEAKPWINIVPAEVYNEEVEEERAERREGGVYHLNNVVLKGKNCITDEVEEYSYWEDEDDDDEWGDAELYGFRRNHILEYDSDCNSTVENSGKDRQDSLKGVIWCEDFMTASLLAFCEDSEDDDDVIIEEITRYWNI